MFDGYMQRHHLRIGTREIALVAAPDERPTALATLVYELLDAHRDTSELAVELGIDCDVRWRGHLEYLRALQRVGREALASA